MTTASRSASGLEGVVAARTVLSDVDGERGRLIVRGRTIHDLAATMDFEGMAAFLWEGLWDGPETAQGVAAGQGEARRTAFARLEPVLAQAAGLPAIDALRFGLAGLRDDEAVPPHFLVTGAAPVVLAGVHRLRQGLPAVSPDPALGQVADFLRMLRGFRATAEEEKALTTYLVTVAEHGMNASTFAARVIASTQAGMVSAVVGAVCALKGPLHGGAPGPVLDMLDAIGSADRIRPWVEGELAAGRRIMGFGHRIYRVRDPRADVLQSAVTRLERAGHGRLAFAQQAEKEITAMLAAHKPDRPLPTNVEFYTALLLEAIGIPRDMFTAVFAMGRVLGWTAHVFEQAASGRLIRPQSEYVGPECSAAAVGN